MLEKLKQRFPAINQDKMSCLSKPQFESYFPSQFAGAAERALSISDKQSRREAKRNLLLEVLEWTRQDKERAKLAWQESAAEPITRLKAIAAHLKGTRAQLAGA